MMSAAFKFIKQTQMLKYGVKLLSAAAVTVASTVTGSSKAKKLVDGKDEILFITKEENQIASTAKIVMQDIGEDRSPVLPNGDINWACSCIEKEIVGPCNIEFRTLRLFMHEKDIKADIEEHGEEMRAEFDQLFEDFIMCTMDYPVYYVDSLLDEEKEEIKKMDQQRKERAERKRQEREANCRHFGKDEVVFITKEENSIPSSVMIPKISVEENRAPLLPNGEINWSCTCIEKDIVGPCNLEFREFREYVARNRDKKRDEITEEGRSIIGNFIGCVRLNPVYYSSLISKNGEDDDVDDDIDDKDFDKRSPTADKKKS